MSDDNGDSRHTEVDKKSDIPKKSKRPMPASARKKLEETKSDASVKKDSTGDNLSIPDDEGYPQSHRKGSSTSSSKSKPMPASARRKLADANSHSKQMTENLVGASPHQGTREENIANQKNKPMPASAKHKLDDRNSNCHGHNDDVTNSNDANDVTATTDKMRKPMPASAKQKMDGKKKETGVRSDSEENASSLQGQNLITPKPSKPMPASVRRKLEVTSESKVVSPVESDLQMTVNIQSRTSKPMPASARRKMDDSPKEKSVDMDISNHEEQANTSHQETSKPTVSPARTKPLGKPGPASAKRKLEEQRKMLSDLTGKADVEGNDANLSCTSEIKTPDAQRQERATETRKSSQSVHGMLKNLIDQKYACQFCGREFYQLSYKNKHEENVHLKKQQETSNTEDSQPEKPPKIPKPKPSKESLTCPHCDRCFKAIKKLKFHIRSCSRPYKFSCRYCDKKFKVGGKILLLHENTHLKQQQHNSSEIDPKYPASPTDKSNISAESSDNESRISIKSSSAGKLKTRAMPKSVKSKLVEETKQPKNHNDDGSSSGTNSFAFKRKISEVISNMESSLKKYEQNNQEGMSSDNELEPPPKKIILTGDGDGSERGRRRPMPASAMKKLKEQKSQEIQSTPKSRKSSESEGTKPVSTPSYKEQEDDVLSDDDLECEVCHRVFNRLSKRQKHERTIHLIMKPRGTIESESKPAIPETDPTPEKIEIHSESEKASISGGSSIKIKPITKLSAPKSNKIYKTAVNKIRTQIAKSAAENCEVPLKSLKTEEEKPQTDTHSYDKAVLKQESTFGSKVSPSSTACPCCNKIFESNKDLKDHIGRIHPEMRRTVSCNLCNNKFSHEEDFIIHLKFRHKELIPGNTSVEVPPSIKTESRNGIVNDQQSSSIKISQTNVKTRRSKRTNGTPTGKISPTLEPMDTHEGPVEDCYQSDSDSVGRLTIKSTYSQKPPSSPNNASESENIPCSSCKDVFGSKEELNKHEQCFHNVKDHSETKMCPICGVYPSRFDRHMLAHENNTIRCCCAPCRLSYKEFSELLKHNLQRHPGPERGVVCAANTPREVIEAEANRSEQELQKEKEKHVFSCKICDKEYTIRIAVKRHIRSAHTYSGDIETLIVKKVKGQEDDQLSKSSGSSSPKVTEPNSNDKGSEDNVSSKPMPAFARAKLLKSKELRESLAKQKKAAEEDILKVPTFSKPNMPMPASIRAKLTRDDLSEINQNKSSNNVNKPMSASEKEKLEALSKITPKEIKDESKLSKPTPASARAKLFSNRNSEENTESDSNSKSSQVARRPMPGSVRAKLLNELDNSATIQLPETKTKGSSSKPGRPMPASVRAKLMNSSKDEQKVISDNNFADNVPDRELEVEVLKYNTDEYTPEVVELDSDDSLHSVPDSPADIPEPEPTRIMRARRSTKRTTEPSDSEDPLVKYKCKLCYKTFDMQEATRRHIWTVHNEYGPDHTENLFEEILDANSTTTKSRRSKRSHSEDDDDYVDDDDNDDEEDDDDDDDFKPRGSRRRSNRVVDSEWSPTTSATEQRQTKVIKFEDLKFACRICGKRMNTSANVKRHVAISHRGSYTLVDAEVVSLDTGLNNRDDSTPPLASLIVVKFQCKCCGQDFKKREPLRRHILIAHPTVSNNVDGAILEIENEHATNSVDIEMTTHTETYDENVDEAEICMEEMVSLHEINVSTAPPIQIEQPKTVVLINSEESSSANSTPKYRPGPASKKAMLKK